MADTAPPSNTAKGASTRTEYDPFERVFKVRRTSDTARFFLDTPEATGRTFGYARVSTDAQVLDRQLAVLHSVGCDKIFTDKLSGKNLNRTNLKTMCQELETGDTVVVESLSRIGRSMSDTFNLIGAFTEVGVTFKSLREHIDTSTAQGRFLLGVFSSIAELEREQIVTNTRQGLAAARQRGRCGGRPSSVTKKQARDLYRVLFNSSGFTRKDASNVSGVKLRTVYRWLAEKAAADAVSDNSFYYKYGLEEFIQNDDGEE